MLVFFFLSTAKHGRWGRSLARGLPTAVAKAA
jgi:hypothetical protein